MTENTENTGIPTMPVMPAVQAPAVKVETEESAPVMPTAPVHEAPAVKVETEAFAKPELDSMEKKISNAISFPVPVGGIKVIATRKGFYNQQRIAKGMPFTVKCEGHLGSWMYCEDANFEKLRVKMLEEKKEKIQVAKAEKAMKLKLLAGN